MKGEGQVTQQVNEVDEEILMLFQVLLLIRNNIIRTKKIK